MTGTEEALPGEVQPSEKLSGRAFGAPSSGEAQSGETEPDEKLSGATLSGELALAEAAHQARRGDLDAALRILDESGPDDPGQQDLRARVHAQRGELAAADAAWLRVLADRPDDPDALAGRRKIAAITAGRRRRRPLPVRTAAAVTMVVLLVGGVAAVDVLAGGPEFGAGASPTPSADRGDTALRHRVGALETQRARQRASDTQQRDKLSSLATALRGDGVRVDARHRDVRVVFEQGLFAPDGVTLTSAGRPLLVALGRRLAGQRVSVTVLGHEVSAPGTTPTGGSMFEVTRASAAATVLAAASGLPLSVFAVAGAEQSARPYPGSDDPARNRTVTLLVTPA